MFILCMLILLSASSFSYQMRRTTVELTNIFCFLPRSSLDALSMVCAFWQWIIAKEFRKSCLRQINTAIFSQRSRFGKCHFEVTCPDGHTLTCSGRPTKVSETLILCVFVGACLNFRKALFVSSQITGVRARNFTCIPIALALGSQEICSCAPVFEGSFTAHKACEVQQRTLGAANRLRIDCVHIRAVILLRRLVFH